MTPDSPSAVVKLVRPSLAGLAILDIGCGAGNFAGLLAAEGADVTGIDPSTEAIRAATAAFPDANFREGVAETLPFEAASFDIALMVNALHHVPETAMLTALAEAARVVKHKGSLIIIEPLPTGSFFAGLRLVEDETVVREAAQHAIETAIRSGTLAHTTTINYVRLEAFRSIDEFLERIISVDPARREIVNRNRQKIAAEAIEAANATVTDC